MIQPWRKFPQTKGRSPHRRISRRFGAFLAKGTTCVDRVDLGDGQRWPRMSDVQMGPGWWQASNGKWYSPDQQSAAPFSGQREATAPMNAYKLVPCPTCTNRFSTPSSAMQAECPDCSTQVNPVRCPSCNGNFLAVVDTPSRCPRCGYVVDFLHRTSFEAIAKLQTADQTIQSTESVAAQPEPAMPFRTAAVVAGVFKVASLAILVLGTVGAIAVAMHLHKTGSRSWGIALASILGSSVIAASMFGFFALVLNMLRDGTEALRRLDEDRSRSA